jgi:lipopolysaccharide transport system ATP-binding protein
MSEVVLSAENISKRYRIGVLNSGSFKSDVQQWLKGISHKKTNQNDTLIDDQSFLALSDINFNIERGEVVGFVGNNGAGKSTLLKIISRIVAPTTGKIYGKGTIASLLEVGTGFHPELTGKENIFLNGHFLGMSRKQINDKLEEIIAFSGVEKFIDTPVKRYSSGMYVRLAFSVAAHIDPDILIIDEALSVGDATFQQKCIAKMKQVASQKDKTILFVSHDLGAVKQICTTAYWLESGKIRQSGTAAEITNQYAAAGQDTLLIRDFLNDINPPGNEFIRIIRSELTNLSSPNGKINIASSLKLNVAFKMFFVQPESIMVELMLFTFSGLTILDVFSEVQLMDNGLYSLSFSIPGHFLNEDTYCISLTFLRKHSEIIFKFENCVYFKVEDNQDTSSAWFRKNWGVVQSSLPISIIKHQ